MNEQKRNQQLSLLYRELEILQGALARAEKKYPHDHFGIITEIYQELTWKRHQIDQLFDKERNDD